MGFKYFNHPLAMSNSEVDRLNNLLHDGHMREVHKATGWSKLISELDKVNSEIRSENIQKLLDEIKKSRK